MTKYTMRACITKDKKQLKVVYIPQQHALYRSLPDIVHKHPQKLCSCRSCHQRAAGKTAQKRSVFVPRGAGKPVNVSDDLKRIGVVLVCHFRI